MSHEIITVGAGHSVRHAASIMLNDAVSGLPVLDDDQKLVGILTEGDLIRRAQLCKAFDAGEEDERRIDPVEAAEDYVKRTSWKVTDCMTSTVMSVTESTPVHEIAAMMAANEIKRVPVMRGDRLVGIVSRSDILACIADQTCETAVKGDVEIRRAVLARVLSDLGYPPHAITVDVSNQSVALSGTVGSRSMADAVRVAAESVPGVGEVRNLIEVEPEADTRNKA